MDSTPTTPAIPDPPEDEKRPPTSAEFWAEPNRVPGMPSQGTLALIRLLPFLPDLPPEDEDSV
jgi:hypothetical protein